MTLPVPSFYDASKAADVYVERADLVAELRAKIMAVGDPVAVIAGEVDAETEADSEE